MRCTWCPSAAGFHHRCIPDASTRLSRLVDFLKNGRKIRLLALFTCLHGMFTLGASMYAMAAGLAQFDNPELHRAVGAGVAETIATVLMLPGRLRWAFSKKVENHAAAVALYFMYYNFGRVHQTLRVTPAMEAGVSDHVWSIEEIVALMK